MHRLTNTWWEAKHGFLSADQFAENHLESNGVDVKRSKFEARRGILTWKLILEYPDQLWNHVDMRECRQQRHRWTFLQNFHLHLHQKNKYLNCEAKECTQKHSGLELSNQRHLRHFQAYGFLNPVIIQCDKEMSIIEVCRRVARERNARTVL